MDREEFFKQFNEKQAEKERQEREVRQKKSEATRGFIDYIRSTAQSYVDNLNESKFKAEFIVIPAGDVAQIKIFWVKGIAKVLQFADAKIIKFILLPDNTPTAQETVSDKLALDEGEFDTIMQKFVDEMVKHADSYGGWKHKK